MLYANYLRNKMRHLVKTLFSSGYPLKIISKFEKKAVDYTIHGNTETGKNLIPYPYQNTTKTTNGITYTDNGDGTITANGTATANAYFVYTNSLKNIDTTKKYVLSGGSQTVSVYISMYQGNTWKKEIHARTQGVVIDFPSYTDIEFDRISISSYVYKGITADNVTVKPMLELGETATEYEPYKENHVGDKTKNLIPYPYHSTTTTTNGITFTDNGDGSVTVNGTATADAYFYFLYQYALLGKEKYILSSNYSQLQTQGILYFGIFKGSNKLWSKRVDDSTMTLDLTAEDYDTANLTIYIVKGKTFNNVTIKPQLELGETATEYEQGGYRIPISNTGENLIKYPYSIDMNRTTGGVTFTDNGYGVITANGTATGNPSLILNTTNLSLENTSYVFHGCPKGGTANKTYYLQGTFYKDGTTAGTDAVVYDEGTGAIINNERGQYDAIRMYIRMKSGSVCNNIVFQPMLNKYELKDNLLPYPYYSATSTVNGITFTDNGDGSITTSGTATANAVYTIKSEDFTVQKGFYVLSGCQPKGSESKYRLVLDLYNGDTLVKSYSDVGIGKIIDLSAADFTGMKIYISVASGTAVEDFIFKPSLYAYKPPIESTTTIIYRSAPLKSGESISRKADNLPDLQLYEGENNITVNTEVKPSAIDVKYLN